MEIIKVDGTLYPCCKKYYFYSLHNAKCRKANGFAIDTDIHYADAVKEDMEHTAKTLEDERMRELDIKRKG